MAHRPDPYARLRRVAWWLLIAVLLAAVFIAWTSVDDAQMRAWLIDGVIR